MAVGIELLREIRGAANKRATSGRGSPQKLRALASVRTGRGPRPRVAEKARETLRTLADTRTSSGSFSKPRDFGESTKGVFDKLADITTDVGGAVGGAVLKGIDYPASAVRSTVARGVGAVIDNPEILAAGPLAPLVVPGAAATAGVAQTAGTEEGRQDVVDRTNTAEYLERAIRKYGWEDTFLNNAAVKTTVGITGDIATDPLTYVGGAGIARAGSKQAAQRLAQIALKTDDAATAARLESAAQMISRRGIASTKVPQEARIALAEDKLANARHALGSGPRQFAVSETGEAVAQGTSKRLTAQVGRAEREVEAAKRGREIFVGAGKARTPVRGTAGVGKALATATEPLRAFRGTAASKYADSWWGQATRPFGKGRSIQLGSDTHRAAEALAIEGTVTTAHEFGQAAKDNFLVKAQKALKGLGDEDMRALGRAVEGAEVPPALQERATLLREALDESAQVSGAPYLRNYLTRILTDESADLVRQGGPLRVLRGASAKGRGTSSILQRRLHEGDEFLGKTITGKNEAEVRRSMEEIWEQSPLRTSGQKLFVDDLPQLMDQYSNMLAAAVRNKRILDDMAENGISLEVASKLARGATEKNILKLQNEAAQIRKANEDRIRIADEASSRAEEAVVTGGKKTLGEALADIKPVMTTPKGAAKALKSAYDRAGVFDPATGSVVKTGYAVLRNPRAVGTSARAVASGAKKIVDETDVLGDNTKGIFLYGLGKKVGVAEAKVEGHIDDAVDLARQSGSDEVFDLRTGTRIRVFNTTVEGSADAKALHKARKYDISVGATGRGRATAFRDTSSEQGRELVSRDAEHVWQRIEVDLGKTHDPVRRAELEAAQRFADEGRTAARAAMSETDPFLAHAFALDAQGKLANAEAIEADWVAGNIMEQVAKLKNSPEMVNKIKDELAGDMRLLADGRMAPEELAGVIFDTAQTSNPNFATRLYSHMFQLTKSYQIANVGFHSRNLMGGVFNNILAGINPSSYSKYMRAMKAHSLGDWDKFARKFPEEAEAFGAWQAVQREAGMGQIGVEVDRNSFKRFQALRKVLPGSPEFAPLWASKRAGSFVEHHMLRGPLAFDHLLNNPADVRGAIERVNKFHFDYSLGFAAGGSADRRIRKVIPFYTWTRRNLPLQVESLVRRPYIFADVERIERNIEGLSPQEKFTPAWYKESGLVRVPVESGGSRGYWNVDLPSEGITDPQAFDPRQYMSNITPLIGVPIERATNRKLFTGHPVGDYQREMPGTWKMVPGLVPALEAFNMVRTDENGNLTMKERDFHSVGQLVPVLATAHRMVPRGDEKYQDQVTGTWLRMFFMPGLRFNTPREKEIAKRYGL